MLEIKKLVKYAGSVSVGTAISRIFGYIRDMLVAYFFGAGMFADAFYAAFRIPNLIRRMLGEGSFSAAFIPVFSEYLHTKSKDEAQKLIDVVFTILTLLLIVITILGVFFSPLLVKIIAYGFTSDPEKLQLTIDLTRLMFPFLLFICSAAMLLALLNTMNSFFIPAIAPANLSFAEIIYMLALAPMLSPSNQIKGLAISVIFGGIGHFFMQYPMFKHLGWKLRFNFNFNHPGVKKIIFLMIPSVIGISVDQINTFVDTICASFLGDGSITALYYSNRLMQLPLAIFGLAMATVSLPLMSKAVAQNNIEEMKQTLNFSIRFSIIALLPATVGLMVIGLPVIQVLFERGKFDNFASLLTNQALFYYVLGLPAYAISKVLANTFFSFQDTKTPVKIAFVVMFIHVILCVILMRTHGVGGLAFATAICAYINVLMLSHKLRVRIGKMGIKKIIASSIKGLIAASIMGLISYEIIKLQFATLFISLIISIIAGIISFVVIAKLLKSPEIEQLLNSLYKKNNAKNS
ncbi:MAG: murein biosynthesis integral membrane protein MurJ [Endomicrobiaceae bacterium]|nr:murein biosynthesis integral membrane protein MurJ [Endomicrobiaceae bacterium]